MSETIRFNLPVKLTIKVGNEKELILNSYLGDFVIAPYDGIVYSTDIDKCGGEVIIKHDVFGKSVYSRMCGVNRISVNPNQRVGKQKNIGIVGKDPIKYTILDKLNIKKKIKPYLDGINSSEEKNKEKENILTPKSNNISKTQNSIEDLFNSLITSPFHVLSGGAIGNELKEEIERIKNLL